MYLLLAIVHSKVIHVYKDITLHIFSKCFLVIKSFSGIWCFPVFVWTAFKQPRTTSILRVVNLSICFWSQEEEELVNQARADRVDGIETIHRRGGRWLSARASDSGARSRGSKPYLRRVVSLSKTLYSLKVLIIPRKWWLRLDMT